jgi:biopolymer transport protein ExbB/TolQ
MISEAHHSLHNGVSPVQGEQHHEGSSRPQRAPDACRGHRTPVGLSAEAATAGASSNRASPCTAKPNGTNVSLALCAVLGAVLTAVLYSIVLTVLDGTYVDTLLAHRGWVQYAIMFLTCWGAAILLLKYRKVRRQRATLSLDLLPMNVGDKIRPDNASRFKKYLDSLGLDIGHNFLAKRIVKVIDHTDAGGDVEEVTDLLDANAEIDACSVQSSYAILKVIIWAIPIFGFLGTVIGIGVAVQQFSRSLEGIQAGGTCDHRLGRSL